MFRNGVNEKIFTEYVYKNFSQKDIALAENELETNINNLYDRVPWDGRMYSEKNTRRIFCYDQCFANC